MRLLLVGGGGREHALAWKLARSPLVERLFAAPGNPGIGRHASCVPIRADAVDALVEFAAAERIDLTVVGPEVPLVAGLADRLAERGVAVFGPSARAAAIEGSKSFAKALMARHGVPTARFGVFTEAAAARRFCRELGVPVVVKADGLAAGKGAVVCRTLEEADRAVSLCLEQLAFGAAGRTVVVEEFMRGVEVSFFALANGRDAMPLVAARDHKTVFDGDRGPNTGGMGAYSPVPDFGPDDAATVMRTIIAPTVAGLAAEGTPYRGVLYAGLMMTAEGPKVVEFNCRFGDPECQAIVARWQDDLVPHLVRAARGEPFAGAPTWSSAAAVCVTLSSAGYPGEYKTGMPISGLDRVTVPDVEVFHAGTELRDGRLVTAGGRVLGVTATGADVAQAARRAYAAIESVHFEGMHYRRDIGLIRIGGPDMAPDDPQRSAAFRQSRGAPR